MQGQGHLTICNGLLGEVVVDAEYVAARILSVSGLAVFAVVHEVLAHCSTNHRSHVLQRSRIGCGSSNNDGVIHSAKALEGLNDAGYGGSLLAYSNIYTDHALALLVDDGINGNRGLTGLTVANDEFALAAANRDHGVNCEDTGLHRLFNRLTLMNAGSLEFYRAGSSGLNGALAVDRLAEHVNNAAEHSLANRNLKNLASGTYLVVFLNCGDVTEEYGANLIFFEVLHQTGNDTSIGSDELEKLARHRTLKAVDTRNTVANLYNRAGLARLNAGVDGVELLAQCGVDRLCGDFSH